MIITRMCNQYKKLILSVLFCSTESEPRGLYKELPPAFFLFIQGLTK